MNIFNPYSYIGGALILAAIGGGVWYQGTEIHHYHVAYNNEHDSNIRLQQTINQMKSTQNTQTTKTEGGVVRVIKIPEEAQPIIKLIKEAPEPANCGTPKLPENTIGEL